MAEQPPVSMVMNASEQMLRYMEVSNGFMQGLSRHLDTNDIVASVHTISGNCAASFREIEWMHDLDCIYVDHEGDNDFMRTLVTRTVRDLAADK